MVHQSQFIEMFGVLQDNTKGFPQKKLGEIAFVTKLAGFEYTKYVKYKPQGDIIMVRGLNCKQGKLILDDIYWIDKETSNFLNRSQLSKGDIVFTYVGTVGEVALIEEDNKYHLAPNVAKISLYNKTENNPEYWTYALLFSRDYVTHFAASTTQAAISMEKIRDILFPIPDYQRQCSFVPIVHQADKSKFDGFKSQFIEQFSDERWPLKSISELCDIVTDGEHQTPRRVDSGIYLLSARNVKNQELSFDEVDYIDEQEYQRIAKRIEPQENDVLISCSGSVGRTCVVPKGIRFQLVRSVALLRFKPVVDPLFMSYQMAMPYVQSQIETLKSQTSQANLFQGNIKKIQVIVPSKEEQKQFIIVVRQADKSKYLN